MKLALANPEHAEKISEFYQAVHDESFPHREMFSASMVATAPGSGAGGGDRL